MRCGLDIAESAALGFLHPGIAVTVTAEKNTLAGLDVAAEDIADYIFQLGTFFLHTCIHFGTESLQLVAYDGVQGNHVGCAVIARTHRTELKLVAGKGKRRCAVAVGIVEQDFRNIGNGNALLAVLALA